jgi:Holliday junction resolvasome RuvABC endonuclease subunit
LNVVGLDLSYSGTGFAHAGGSQKVAPKKGAEMPSCARLLWFRETIDSLLTGAQIVAIEGYAFGAMHSQAHKIGELGGVIRLMMWEKGIPYVDIPPTSHKKYATGAGNAKKDAVLASAIRRLGYEGSSHDEADALWLRAMALDHYGMPVVVVPSTHKEALVKVEWPVLEKNA